MSLLKEKNSNKRDLRVEFNDTNHSYMIDSESKAISVTQLIQKFFPKFDKEFWANKESIKTGKSKSEILKGWKELGEKARNLGTELHEQIENYYNK